MTIDTWWMGVWEGNPTPICQTYRIRVRYFPYRFWEHVTIGHPHVTVKVIDPLVAPDSRGTGERTPHVYSYGYPPELPALCTWDPTEDEWNPDEYIVDKIIPWTIKWLLFYEDWLDTGIWQGRGRHPDLARTRACDCEDAVKSQSCDPTLFHSFGARVGLHSSGLALALAAFGVRTDFSWPSPPGNSPRRVTIPELGDLPSFTPASGSTDDAVTRHLFRRNNKRSSNNWRTADPGFQSFEYALG